MPVIGVPEACRCYTHMNFTARPIKEGSQEQLFFAEIYHCGKRRGAMNGFCVTCCEPLGPDSTGEYFSIINQQVSIKEREVDNYRS